MRRTRLLLSLLALAGLVAGLVPASLGAQEAEPGNASPVVVRFYYASQAELDAVAGSYDVWSVDQAGGFAIVQLSPDEFDFLQAQGARLEVDQELTARAGINAALDPQYYYYDNYYVNSNNRYWVTFLQDTNAAYPDITELIDVGDAWGGMHGEHHRDMWVLRVSNEDPAFGPIASKPPFMIGPQAHAREVTTPEMAIRYIKYLTSGYNGIGGYGVDPDVTWMIDWHALYIFVGTNPDGHWKNEQNTSLSWRKNIDNDDGCSTGSYGTDINRNFAFKWGCCGGSSGNCSSDTYRGPARASEPETTAVQNYFGTIFADWNGNNGDDEIPSAAPDTTIGIWLSIHTYQDLVLWPWGFTSSTPPNSAQLQTIGRKLAYHLESAGDGANYIPEQSRSLYVTDGSSDDWTYGKYGIPSYTFEMGPQYGGCSGFFPSFDCQEGTNGAARNFWAEFRPTAIYMTKIARMPYREGYGPDAQNIVASPNPVQRGDPLSLSALLQDHRSNGDSPTNIAGAEYFIDNPGVNGNSDGTGTAMAAQDGAWGGASETGIATIDTSHLSVGRHYVLVHAYGSNGFWGPLTAIFFEVAGTPCNPPDNLAFTWTPTVPDPGEAVSFSGSAEGDPTIVYTWAFGDGQAGSGQNPSHSYAAGGDYDVVMTATNDCDVSLLQQTLHVCEGANSAGFTWAPAVPVPGDTIDFSGTAAGDAPIAYAWDFGDGETGSGQNPSHSYTLPGDYAVVMTATNACGEQVVQESVHICEPVSDADFSWLPAEPVAGHPVDFTGTAAGEEPLSFFWDFGDNQGGGGQNISHVYGAAGTYTVEMTVTGACGEQLVAYDLTIAPPCDPITNTAFTWTPITPTAGESVTFSGSAEGTHPISYAWDFGDGNTGSGANPAHSYATAGTYTVVLTATNDCGEQVVDHTVTVLEACRPVDNAVFRWSPPSPLVGEPVYLTGTATGTLPIDYAWDLGDGTTASGPNVTHSYTTAGSYIVVMTATNGCDEQVVGHTVTVVEECVPPAGVSFTWTPPNPAAGQPVTFSSAVLTGTAPLAFAWNFGDGNVGSGASVVHTYAAPGNYTVVLTATNSCGESAVQESVIVAGVCEPPSNANFSWTPPMPLVDETVTFNGTAEGSAPIAYGWDWGDGTTGSGATATRAYAAIGDYLVTMMATNDCGEIEVVHLVHVVSECVQPDGASFSWAPLSPTAGQQVTFDAALISGTNPLTFTWTLGDGNTAVGMQVTHNYTAAGDYTVTLTVTNPCGETGAVDVISVLTAPAQQWRIFLPVVYKGRVP